MSERSRTRKQQPTRSRARLRIWAVINLAILLAFTGWVFHNVNQTQANAAATKAAAPGAYPTAGSGGSAAASPSAPPPPSKAQVLALAGGSATSAATGASSAKYFGVTAINVPWKSAAMKAIATKAGVTPNMAEYYVNWTQSFDPTAVSAAYAEGALPVLTWESFSGLGGSSAHTVDQPDYSLSTIIDGKHDAYITAFAKAVKAQGLPIVIRYDHEMNGDWFPWSEGYNGNYSGQYVKAWRHVWTVFQQVGATNVIWDWAPNITRGATNSDLEELYPGDKYVDWLGMSAYDDYETTAKSLILPTLDEMREFTQKPLLITETGSQPGSQKTEWTANFLSWIATRPDIIGFVWNEITASQGSGANWDFESDADTLAAFRSGIKNLALVKVPAV